MMLHYLATAVQTCRTLPASRAPGNVLKPQRQIFLLVVLLCLSGCSLPGGGGLPGPLGDNTSKSPDDLVKASVDAVGKTKSFHVKLESTLFSIDVDVLKGAGLAGTVSVFGSSADYIATGGKVYTRGPGDQKALQKLGKPDDTWVIESPNKSSFDLTGGLSDYDISKFYSCIVSAHGTLTKGQQTVVADVEVQETKDAGDVPGSTPATYYIAKKNTAYPIQLVQKGATKPGGSPSDACKAFNKSSSASPTPSGSSFGSGPAPTVTITFSQFDKSVDIKAPSNTVDQSDIGGASSFSLFGSN